MVYILDPEKLKETLKPMGTKSRGLYMSRAIQDIISGKQDYKWVKEQTTTSKRKKIPPKEYTESFEEFWAAYHPSRRKAKRKTFESFWNADDDQAKLLSDCLAALKWMRETEAWQENDGKYFPISTTFINQRRFEDEDPNAGQGLETYYNSEGELKTRPRKC